MTKYQGYVLRMLSLILMFLINDEKSKPVVKNMMAKTVEEVTKYMLKETFPQKSNLDYVQAQSDQEQYDHCMQSTYHD